MEGRAQSRREDSIAGMHMRVQVPTKHFGFKCMSGTNGLSYTVGFCDRFIHTLSCYHSATCSCR